MTEQELWTKFTQANPGFRDAPYEAWCYGSDTPDLLAELTAAGTKTATASAYPFYEYEQCDLPKPGDLGLICKTDGEAVCVIRTTKVTVVPFLEVGEEQAYKEGEGDRSLRYWREAHRKAFSQELAEINQEMSDDMPVVCEEFEVLCLA